MTTQKSEATMSLPQQWLILLSSPITVSAGPIQTMRLIICTLAQQQNIGINTSLMITLLLNFLSSM